MQQKPELLNHNVQIVGINNNRQNEQNRAQQRPRCSFSLHHSHSVSLVISPGQNHQRSIKSAESPGMLSTPEAFQEPRAQDSKQPAW